MSYLVDLYRKAVNEYYTNLNTSFRLKQVEDGEKTYTRDKKAPKYLLSIGKGSVVKVDNIEKDATIDIKDNSKLSNIHLFGKVNLHVGNNVYIEHLKITAAQPRLNTTYDITIEDGCTITNSLIYCMECSDLGNARKGLDGTYTYDPYICKVIIKKGTSIYNSDIRTGSTCVIGENCTIICNLICCANNTSMGNNCIFFGASISHFGKCKNIVIGNDATFSTYTGVRKQNNYKIESEVIRPFIAVYGNIDLILTFKDDFSIGDRAEFLGNAFLESVTVIGDDFKYFNFEKDDRINISGHIVTASLSVGNNCTLVCLYVPGTCTPAEMLSTSHIRMSDRSRLILSDHIDLKSIEVDRISIPYNSTVII